MNLTRADEYPIEMRRDDNSIPGSVKDWHTDRLASLLVQVSDVFDRAIAGQQKLGPVSSEVVLQVQATLSDMRQAAAHDPRAAADMANSAEQFLAHPVVAEVLPSLLKENPDGIMLAGEIAQIANGAFAQSSFYGVTQDACANSAHLEVMCERAHALVKAGYIGEKELEGVQVSLSDPDSAKAKAAESFYMVAKIAGYDMSEPASESNVSMFMDDRAKLGTGETHTTPTINVSTQQAHEMLGEREDAAAKVFSHEIGHWLARDKTPQMLAAGLEGVLSSGGTDAKHVEAFFKATDLEPKSMDMLSHKGGGLLTQELRTEQYRGGDVSLSWTKAIKEMQGDLMSLAIENVVKGKSAALDSAEGLIKTRDLERLDALAFASRSLDNGTPATLVRFGEEHHTTAAVRDFAERIKAGDLDKVHSPQQLDKLMGESIVRGLVEEYSMVRGAELNIHHVENGKAVAGVPPGVDLKAVLASEMNSSLAHVPGMPTYLVAEKPTGLIKDPPSVAVDVQLRGSGEPAQKMWLTNQAPSGVAEPLVEKGPQQIQGREIAGTMVALAKETLAAGHERVLDGPAASENSIGANPSKLQHAPDASPGSKMPDPQAKAEASQPAPAMSM